MDWMTEDKLNTNVTAKSIVKWCTLIGYLFLSACIFVRKFSAQSKLHAVFSLCHIALLNSRNKYWFFIVTTTGQRHFTSCLLTSPYYELSFNCVVVTYASKNWSRFWSKMDFHHPHPPHLHPWRFPTMHCFKKYNADIRLPCLLRRYDWPILPIYAKSHALFYSSLSYFFC